MKKKENSSSCAGRNRKYRNLILLLAGVALTSASIFLARQRITAAETDIQRRIAPVYIVVPSVPIPAGTAFSVENLSRKSVPASGISSRNVPAADFELLLGARAKGNLAAGEPVLWTDVEEPFDPDNFSTAIPAGRRAFTVEASNSSSFAGLIRPGDCVDLLCEDANGKGMGTWIRSIPVISVDRLFRRTPAKDETHEVSTITLSVTPQEGWQIASASRAGRIHWFLRNPDEPARAAASRSSSADRSAERIEIWKAGVQELVPPVAIGERG
jgi:pilus assembly protein CpaB